MPKPGSTAGSPRSNSRLRSGAAWLLRIRSSDGALHEPESSRFVQGGNLPGIVTRDRAIRTLDDLRGLRLRAPSEVLAVLKDLGADPIDMPMGEVYSALAKGVLDGVVAPPDTLKSLHFAEVAKYSTRSKFREAPTQLAP